MCELVEELGRPREDPQVQCDCRLLLKALKVMA